MEKFKIFLILSSILLNISCIKLKKDIVYNKTLNEKIKNEIEILESNNIPQLFIDKLVGLANNNNKTITEYLEDLYKKEKENEINKENKLKIIDEIILNKNNNIDHEWYSTKSLNISKISLKYNTEWMKNIDNNTNIQQLSIPGTHDTCTNKFESYLYLIDLIIKLFAQTQSWNLEEQLIAGIRYFDFRVNSKGFMEHGIFQTINTLKNSLKIICNFLSKHSSEGIILRLKINTNPCDDYCKNFITSILNEYKDFYYLSKEIPIIDKIRGKIFLLPEHFDYGNALDFTDEKINIQDFYNIKCEQDIKTKKILINRYMEMSYKKDKFIINHISASAVPMLKSIYFTSNIFNLIPYQKTDKFYGIFPIDYPSEELVSKIININF